jgi:hypothetical protein
MKITPEINFTFVFTQDEMKLLFNELTKESMCDDEWETSPLRRFNEKLLNVYELFICREYTITLTLSEAKELVQDIADSNNFCSGFNKLWKELWNTLKNY